MRPPHHYASPEASDDSGGGGSTVVPQWLERDWENYDFQAGGGDGAGGGQGAGGASHSGADPLATMLDGLPGFIAEDIGFIAEDIASLLHNLPLPAAGNAPGMSVEEAIQVLHTVCYIACYVCSYVMYHAI
jgi:hypothetical protein